MPADDPEKPQRSLKGVPNGDREISLERTAALTSARRKAYLRSIPLLFVCYIIAYIDRTNVGIAQLTMREDLPLFDSWVFGFGSGIFFLGYFLLEIPGSILVERWSARKWICRIMVTWGILAAGTAFVTTPLQFYIVRFFLGVAEAGFFPGVLVYLTHWFTVRDRARAISLFLIASPIAMMIGPAVSQGIIEIGRTHLQSGIAKVDPSWEGFHFYQWTYLYLGASPEWFGMKGWQLIYILWGFPAVVMGFVVLRVLADRPRHAGWLTSREKEVLESELDRERSLIHDHRHHSAWAGLSNPKVWMLSLAFFGIVTANYGIEFFLPSILKKWYHLQPSHVAWLVTIPSILVMIGQIGIGWSSDHFHERRWHSVLPVAAGAIMLVIAPFTEGHLVMTMACFTIAAAGMKAYMPAFWSLPNLFLTSTAAAGSVGMINSIGNLGGFLGPFVLGYVDKQLGSYTYGLWLLSFTSFASVLLIALMPFPRSGEKRGD